MTRHPHSNINEQKYSFHPNDWITQVSFNSFHFRTVPHFMFKTPRQCFIFNFCNRMFKRKRLQALYQNIVIQCSQILNTNLMNDFHLFSQFSNRNQILLDGTMQCPHAIKYSIIFLNRHPSPYPFIDTGDSCQRMKILRNKQMPHLPDKVRICSFSKL